MANWWEDVANWFGGLGSQGNVGYAPQAGSMAPGTSRAISQARVNARKRPTPVTPATDAAYKKQQSDLAALGGAGALRNKVGNELGRQQAMAQQPGGLMGMTDDELLGWLLGGAGGGGAAPDLSGYNTLLGDVNNRRDALNIRKWEQRKFLRDLFDAAESRAMSDRNALAAAVEGQLASDAARRQTEMGLIRADDAGRLATANAAREALGVAAPQADVASEVAQNAVAGVGSAGAVSDRDARINQAIQAQQFNAEIAGLAPMEQMATGQLMNTYEDRLAALAGERAAIQAQIAQARAAARGGGGPSVSEKLAALNFVQGAGEGPEMPAASGGQAILQSYSANDPGNARTYATIYNSIAPLLSSYTMSTTGKMMDPTELANTITRDNPGLINSGAARDFLQQLVKDYLG